MAIEADQSIFSPPIGASSETPFPLEATYESYEGPVRNRCTAVLRDYGRYSNAAEPDAEAKRVATAMVDRFVDSWNRADGIAYGVNYWPEAELVDPSGDIVSGQPAIVQEHVEMWAGPFKGSHIVCKVRRVRRLGPMYLLVDFDAEVSGVVQGPPGSGPGKDHVLRSHLKHIMEKRHGEWKVLAAQNTFSAAQ